MVGTRVREADGSVGASQLAIVLLLASLARPYIKTKGRLEMPFVAAKSVISRRRGSHFFYWRKNIDVGGVQ